MKISCSISILLTHELFQTSKLILFITKILSLAHKKCRSKPNIWIFPPPLLQKNKYGRSELYQDQIFSRAIYLYDKKFDWLFIVDPIWLLWHTYISLSLTHSWFHWPVHNIPDTPTKRYFFYKQITQKCCWKTPQSYMYSVQWATKVDTDTDTCNYFKFYFQVSQDFITKTAGRPLIFTGWQTYLN